MCLSLSFLCSCFDNEKSKRPIPFFRRIECTVLVTIFLYTNWHSEGNMVNITLAALTFPWHLPGTHFRLCWPGAQVIFLFFKNYLNLVLNPWTCLVSWTVVNCSIYNIAEENDSFLEDFALISPIWMFDLSLVFSHQMHWTLFHLAVANFFFL